MKTVRASQIF